MKTKKINIIFVIPTLTAGGAQRIMAFLSRNLNQQKFSTTLIVLGSNKGLAFDIKDMRVIFLNKTRVLLAIPALIRILIHDRPQIIMGAITHLNILLGFISPLFPKTIFVGRQTNISTIMSKHSGDKPKFSFASVLKIGFRQLGYVVCQSKDMAIDCIAFFNIKEDKIEVIRNPITDNFGFEGHNRNPISNTKKFITVGRLDKIKGYGRILKGLSQYNSEFNYTIIGDGPEKEFLENLVKSLKLQGKVEFIPFTKKVPNYLRNSDFFIQGSYAEGFPNALLESCAVGTPVIAWKAPGGTKEIIEHEVNGLIAEDDEDFVNILNTLKHFDPKKVSDSVHIKFSKEIILKDYETFFSNILNKRKTVVKYE
ncbi:hypothetical protein LCGC14_1567940 [marine sediment metagenome]|uniref:Glycosyltransferase n=2 Tax=root TaxID=1 RepID=A0A831QS02_9FLAO|nr:glycosyltransferase [Pricia antarctica]